MAQLSEKIKFAHISPYQFMELAESFSGINLVLAHLVGKNKYTEFYSKSRKFTIMDNGAFELGESYDPEKLIDLGHQVKADYLVLPDYPGQDWRKTVKAAEHWAPKFIDAGFKPFFVPQSTLGDIEGYFKSWHWAIDNPNIYLIGCSILGAPTAWKDQNLNRITSRFKTLSDVISEVSDEKKLYKRVHMLGMLDTVREIALCNVFKEFIYSWDSSAAVWYGMSGLLVSETFEKLRDPVDFNAGSLLKDQVIQNINYVNSLLEV